MNPTTAVRLQGYRIAFPGYLPWNPGSAIPFGGPQKQLAFYQDFNWVKGKHDLRFGGYYMHMNDDRTFGAYANSVESLNTTSAALPSLDNFVLGQIRRFQGAINPNGFPGGTYTTPVGFPSFTSYNKYDEFALYANDTWSIGDRLKINLGLRYEYFGPQKKTEPKYDSNFYYSDDGCSVNTSSPTQLIDCIRGGSVLTSNESPGRQPVGERLEQLRPPRRLRLGRERRRQDVAARRLRHRLRAQLRQRDLQRALQPAGVPGGLDRRADRRADRCRSTPTTRGRSAASPASPSRSRPAACATWTRTSRRPTATSTACRCSGRSPRTPWRAIEYTGSTGRKLYDLADPNKRGAALVYQGVGTANQRPITQYAAFNTRGNRGQSQYHGVTFGLESRKLGNSGVAVHREVHLLPGEGQPQLDVLGLGRELQPGVPRRVRPDARLRLRRVRHPPPRDPRRHLGAAALPQLGGRREDAPRRLAAQLDLHRPQRPSVLPVGLHERPRLLHARRGPGRHRQERLERAVHGQPERVPADRPVADRAATPAAT